MWLKKKIKKCIVISARFSSEFNLITTFNGDLKCYDYLQNLSYAKPTENDDKTIDFKPKTLIDNESDDDSEMNEEESYFV